MQDRVRVHYDEDNIIRAVDWFVDGKVETDADKLDYPISLELASCQCAIVDAAPFMQDHEYTEQLYIEDEMVCKDDDKCKSIMPVYVIKKKHIQHLVNEVTAELSKAEPDAAKLIKLQIELTTSQRCGKAVEWYGKALIGLIRADVDKPIIKQKLEDKIAELKK